MKPNSKPNFNKLVKLTKQLVDEAMEDKHWDDDNVQYIFEEVMVAMYGNGIFKKLDEIWE